MNEKQQPQEPDEQRQRRPSNLLFFTAIAILIASALLYGGGCDLEACGEVFETPVVNNANAEEYVATIVALERERVSIYVPDTHWPNVQLQLIENNYGCFISGYAYLPSVTSRKLLVAHCYKEIPPERPCNPKHESCHTILIRPGYG